MAATSLSGASEEEPATGSLADAPSEQTALTASGEQNREAPVQMSPVADSASEDASTFSNDQSTLAVVQDQSKPAVYTGIAPGICLVVDDIVRQFCAANPDDISCQFQ